MLRTPTPNLLRTLGVLASAAALAACRTWRPAGPVGVGTPEPARVVAAASGASARPVRLTTRRGETVVLLAPRVERDSVVGTEARGRARRAVALAEVAGVEAWRVGAGTTVAGVAAGALLATGARWLVVTALVARGT